MVLEENSKISEFSSYTEFFLGLKYMGAEAENFDAVTVERGLK